MIERATKSANSVANQTVSTVTEIGTSVADGVVVTVNDLRTGILEGNIRPRTVIVAAAIGLIAVVEWPVLLAAGGAFVIASKLKRRPTDEADPTESPTDDDTDSAEPEEPHS